MGKKHNEAAHALQSWDDVDKCLREIGECEIIVAEIEGEMNTVMAEAKAKADSQSKPITENIARLKALIEDFANVAKPDMETKTVKLLFGQVGFRSSSHVAIAPKNYAAVLANLKKHDMRDCIVTKESISREALERYPDKDIKKVGAARKVTDTFWCEADREKVRRL